ncbi:related to carboxylesterase [Phialocephala subalpina]|uniref:Related to carboxylesterase n=1 Tax=Phialocephala subalpina TaxID=576137 RepID=A0A1L7XKL3_9HELO|nr:related to carboxylesterase [Phialocephala subalpina]
MAVLKHASFGDLTGVSVGGVTQYLGIKYASLKNRLSAAELYDGTPGSSIDATKLGYLSFPSSTFWDMLIPDRRPTAPGPPIGYIDCLNLNISVLELGNGVAKNLPVFAFFHGGGFHLGSNAWPQYDLVKFVKLSAEKGLPVIGVGVNYRLAVNGFLTSGELVKAGYKPNNGLWDQKVALSWIKKHISGFGGDGSNITWIGESAGAISATFHLQSKEPLFKRFIAMSGTSWMLKALPPLVTEFAYNSVLEALGIQELGPEERIEKFLEIPMGGVVGKLGPQIPLMPSIDGDIILNRLSFEEAGSKASAALPGKTSVELLIGDVEFDGSIFSFMLHPRKAGCRAAFTTSIQKSLPDAGDSVLQAYNIRSDISDDEAFLGILNFANDIAFHAPTLTFAKGWLGKKFAYYFDEPNPWDGPWKGGRATHVLDVAYIFQNYNEFLDDEQKVVAERFAESLLCLLMVRCRGLNMMRGRQGDRAGKELPFLARENATSPANAILRNRIAL